MAHARVASRVAVIVLAAGRSTRFHSPDTHKLLAPLAGAPVVRWSVASAVDARVGEVIVVTGNETASIERALAGMRVHIVEAPDAARGMSASLRRGTEVVRDAADAVVVALADQPTLRPDAYRRVVATWGETGAPIVSPRYPSSNAPAHPTLFAASVLHEIAALTGDIGARTVIARDPSRVAFAAMDWPMPRDIDTLEDLALVEAELRQQSQRSPEQ